MKSNKFINKITSMPIILGIQVIASAILMFFIFKLNIFPLKYILAISAALLIVLGIFILIYYSGIKKHGKDNNSKRSIITKFVSILVSIVLMIGTSYVVSSDSFIKSVDKNKNKSTYVVNVIALKDSKDKGLPDIDGQRIGVCYKNDTETITKAIAHFEEVVDKKTEKAIGAQEYTKIEDYVKLADELYAGNVDVIIVGNEYKSMLEQNHENFDAETKVIASYEITKVNKSTTVPTNVTENPFTIYVTGIDAYGDVSTVSRSDVNLIITVNPKTKQILMVSIPRDTEVILHSKKAMDKLTHSGLYGHEETISTIEDFLDVEINYYARTNFSGIIDIVDALGGITIDSPYDEFETLHGNYIIPKGINEMDGDMALCFVRERYRLPNGDFDRGRNQQMLLSALLDKAMSPSTITNFSNILNSLEGTFETDMSGDEIKSLINMQMSNMSEWSIHKVQVSGNGYKTTKTYSMWGTEVYVMEPNGTAMKQIKQLIDEVEAGKVLTDIDVEGLE